MVRYDKSDMLEILEDFPKQCRKAQKLTRGMEIKGKFKNICVCGMGGSGIVGDLLKTLLKNNKIQVFSHHNYKLPKQIDKKSLVITVSYSGNTEETLSAYKEAKKRKAKILAVTSGGKLGKKAKKVIKIPEGYEPRNAIGYLFISVVSILYKSKIIPNQSSGIREAIKIMKTKEYRKKGFVIAKKIHKKIPVFYASDDLGAVAYRIKTAVNENAKQPAFYNVFPEMNHNELNGFKKYARKLVAVFIKDKHDLKKIQQRMKITKNLIKDRIRTADIKVRGKSLITRILTTLYIGDLTSYYLALMNKQDPSEIPIIDELKKELE